MDDDRMNSGAIVWGAIALVAWVVGFLVFKWILNR